jgi:hypothetical protein
VFDEHEIFLEELRVRADRHQRERLLKFAAPYVPPVWAIEGARGLGALLAQQLVVSDETALDRPAEHVGDDPGDGEHTPPELRHEGDSVPCIVWRPSGCDYGGVQMVE